MSFIVFGGRPRRGGGGFIGLYAAKDATTILKIKDKLFAHVHFVFLVAATASGVLRA